MEYRSVIPTTQLAHRKGTGICDENLCMSQTSWSALESGQEARIVQIDFRAAFDRLNYLVILFKLRALAVLCCQFSRSFFQIGLSTL